MSNITENALSPTSKSQNLEIQKNINTPSFIAQSPSPSKSDELNPSVNSQVYI